MSILETVSGKMVDVLDIPSSGIAFEDIAWAMSRAPRFAGHSTSQLPYSVAQHSTFVGWLAVERWKKRWPLGERAEQMLPFAWAHAHLHDVSEGLLTDIPTPIKHLPQLAGYRELEAQVQTALMREFFPDFFVLDEHDREIIEQNTKVADLMALRYEAYHLANTRGRDWNAWRSVPEVQAMQPWLDKRTVVPLPCTEAFEEFVDTWKDICQDLPVIVSPHIFSNIKVKPAVQDEPTKAYVEP